MPDLSLLTLYSCRRRGAATFVNLDFCTGGKLKNMAFAEGVRCSNHNLVFDISWTLEARSDEEMPERLLGGATLCRLDYEAAPQIITTADGRHSLAGEMPDAPATAPAIHTPAVSSPTPAVPVPRSPAPLPPKPAPAAAANGPHVPHCLSDFVAARERGDMTAAAACCTIDLECVGPLGSTKGLSDAKTTYFYRPSHAGARVVVHLAPDRSRKEPANTKASQPTMWKREVEIDMEGPFGAVVLVEQRFTVSYASAHGPRISRVEIIRRDVAT